MSARTPSARRWKVGTEETEAIRKKGEQRGKYFCSIFEKGTDSATGKLAGNKVMLPRVRAKRIIRIKGGGSNKL